MTGTKAVFLENWARETGRGFVRFDYTGHGNSSGAFEDGCLSDWIADARAVIEALTEGPVILVGSSMGGWVALQLARDVPQRVAGIVGIASAPDFTEDSMWAAFSEDQREVLMRKGRVELPTEYDDQPYVITKRLIEDGRQNLVLRDAWCFDGPIRLLHGTADADVAQTVPLRILEHISCPDLQLTLVKEADHRFSEPDNLWQIVTAVETVTDRHMDSL